MKKEEKIILAIYLLAQLIIYISFLTMDFFNLGNSTYLKFSSIIINLVLATIFSIKLKKVNLFFLLGLVFTLLADTFLLVLDSYYSIGLVCFNIVQFFYFLGLKNAIKKSFIPQLIIRISLFTFSLIIGLSLSQAEIFLSISYICSMILTIFTLIFDVDLDKEKMVLLWGLILFLLCDINVGLFNLGYYFNLSYEITLILESISTNLMWFFYLPSQVEITLYLVISTKKERLNKRS